jgi:hypothetical protein
MTVKRNVILIGLRCLLSFMGSVQAQELTKASSKPQLNCPSEQMTSHDGTKCPPPQAWNTKTQECEYNPCVNLQGC